MNRNKAIPSMFHRRLVLLFNCMLVVLLLLVVQIARLTMVHGQSHFDDAESRLDRRKFFATTRGNILDRKGRILAEDAACYDIAVHYDVITGNWQLHRARQAALRLAGDHWETLGPEQREAAISRHIEELDRIADSFWQTLCETGGIERDTLDQRLDAIRTDVENTALAVWVRQSEKYRAKYGDDDEFERRPIAEQEQPHVVLPRVSDDVAFRFNELHATYPDMFEVQDSYERSYPWLRAVVELDRSTLPEPIRSEIAERYEVDGIADHMLGNMRADIWKEDMDRRSFFLSDGGVDLKGYRQGDMVGAAGVEAVFEDALRGICGMELLNVHTGESARTPAQPGLDLQLTIDVLLQARVQAILSPEFGLTRVNQWQVGWDTSGTPRPSILPLGTPLNSAAVVIDVQTGDVLAAVSMPTRAMGERLTQREKWSVHPEVNRPFEAIYPPGSIIKPLVLAAAVGEHQLDLHSQITCNGHYFEDKLNIARCWIYREAFGHRTHGALGVSEALARSCNIFFYTLADRTGMRQLTQWYSRFGLGQRLNAGLTIEHELTRSDGTTEAVTISNESTGTLPAEEDIEALRRTGQMRFSSIIMGIGQGPVTWTPLQAANAYAIIARQGLVRDPSIVTDRSLIPGRTQRENINLLAEYANLALEGLRQSVEERHGTGHHISYPGGRSEPILNAPGVTVWAKTGTAQAPAYPIIFDEEGKATDYLKGLDHAWFVGLVGPRGGSPKYSIAVVVELGGSGGRTAGPVANQIIHALMDEGYLPSSDAPGMTHASGPDT